MDILITQKIQDSFARQSLMQTLGAKLSEISVGTVTLTCPITDNVKQQHGVAHAGLTFALGDSAAGYSALSVMDPDMEVLTTEMKINLLAPADGHQLIARGRVIKSGRKLVIVAADVFADDRHVATMLGTMIPARVS